MAGIKTDQPNALRVMLAFKVITKSLVFIGLWIQTDNMLARGFIILYSLFTVISDGAVFFGREFLRPFWVCMLGEIFFILILSFWFSGWPYLILMQVLIGVAAFGFVSGARWWLMAGLLVVNFFMVVTMGKTSEGIDWGAVVSNFLSSIFVAFTFGIIALLEDRRMELQHLNRKLEDYANQVEELAVTKERNRMAREIHDTVAHGITGLMMQLQAARKVNRRNPDKADELLAQSEDVAREVLREMRQSVRALAPEKLHSLSGHAALEDLIESFGRTTEMKILFEIHGHERSLDAERQMALYRVLQETLTNARRHGEATRAWVTVSYQHTGIVLTVRDNGNGFAQLKEGFGITGMKGRVQEVHGTFEINSEPGNGCTVHLAIPYDGGHAQKYESAHL